MDAMVYRGKAWRFGVNVDTDVIIAARYLTSTDPAFLAEHLMEDADPEFAKKVRPGDVIVAGENFGSGSSREHAPMAIKGAGVSCVVAGSFARIFYRNAINIGLPVVECPEAVAGTDAGDELEVAPLEGQVRNLSKGTQWSSAAYPEFMRELIESGGLIPYTRRKLGLEA